MGITLEELAVGIEAGRAVTIRGHIFGTSYRKRLSKCLEMCLAEYDRGDLFPVIYTVVQELATWAALENMRQVFFEEAKLDLNDPATLDREEGRFLSTVGALASYRMRTRQKGLTLETRIVHSPSGLRVEIWNNARHPAAYEERLRNRLRVAMGSGTLEDILGGSNDDDLGRGLSMALVMLREAGLQPELMRIGQTAGRNVSRLEIAFDPSFVSIRNRILKGEELRPFDGRGAKTEKRVDVRVECPYCHQNVDEHIFFHPVSADMADLPAMISGRPGWTPELGACASCVAGYG